MNEDKYEGIRLVACVLLGVFLTYLIYVAFGWLPGAESRPKSAIHEVELLFQDSDQIPYHPPIIEQPKRKIKRG